MKKWLYIIILQFLLLDCKNILYKDYVLTIKYPRDVPDLELKILNDTAAVVIKQRDKTIKQDFRFKKSKNHFMIITNIDNTNDFLSLEKGDTIIYYKKKIYVFDRKQKLIFNQKND